MKMKTAPLALLAIAFIAAVMITPIHGSFIAKVYAWTDKPSYLPGDTGVLHVTVRNTGTQSFTVRNISITYPWMAFVIDHWDGNSTNVVSPVAPLAAGQTFNTQYSFTVPTDGRAVSGQASVSAGTDIGTNGSFTNPVTADMVIALPSYQPFGFTTSILPIITIVLLGLAVAMLALVYMGLRKQSKK